MSVRWAQIYHLKLVGKNHAKFCKFPYQVIVRFYGVLTRSCLFVTVPGILKICLYMSFLEPLMYTIYFIIKSSAVEHLC